MKISIEATDKEIADLILQLQGQPCLKDASYNPKDAVEEAIKDGINAMGKNTEYPLSL